MMTADEIYAQAIANGCSPKLADMFASRKAPGANTDREFLEGHCNGSQFVGNERRGNRLKQMTKRYGYTPGPSDVYLSQLARFPGDPEAWVSSRGDVKRVCQKRGWGCEGAVNTNYVEQPAPKKVKLAESLIREEMARRIAKDPSLATKKRKLREEIIAKHGNPRVRQ